MKNRPVQAAAALSAALLASSLIAACSSSGTSGSSSTSTSTSSAIPSATQGAACQGTPAAGGTLTLAVQNQTLSLNPYNTPGGFGDGEAQSLIMQGLVRLDPTGKTGNILPAIADRWSLSADGKSYTFHIRKGVTFSNGQPVTGADIKNSLDNWANPKLDQYASSFSAGYKDTTVVDASDVRIDLSQPTGGFLYYLAMPPAEVYPASLSKTQGSSFWNNPVGSGPYTVKSWVKGSSITFAKNPKYWESGHPLLEEVVFNFVTDDSTRLLDLENGQAQIIDSVPFDQVSALKGHKNVVVAPYKIPSWILLSINNQKKQFSNVATRQALNYAIDRNAINAKIYSGLATVPNSMLPQLQYDAPDSQVPADTYDLAKAKQLMSKAGQASGFTATLEYPSGNPEFGSLALVLQQEWAQLGVKLTLRAEDQATLSKSFSSGSYDLIMPYALAVSDVVIPDEFASLYALPGATHGFYSFWSDPSVATMVTQLVHGAPDQRAALWPKIQAALQQQQPALNVLDLPFLEGLQSSVCANYLTAIGYETLTDTWVAK